MSRADSITTSELKEMLDRNVQFLLLDVRTSEEISREGQIDVPRQMAIPSGLLNLWRLYNELADIDLPVIIYCDYGLKSAFAAETMKQMGFTNVWNYSDGYLSWQSSGYPVRQIQLSE